jgi:insulysin
MAYIKSKGWANGLSAGGYSVCPGSDGIFSINIRLTEEGLKNYKELIKIVFQYISMLKETPPQEWIFEEQKVMADVDFRFKQKSSASKFTSKLAGVMQQPLPREWLLSGHSRLRKFDPAAIQAALNALNENNFRFVVVSQNFPGGWDQKEKWYGTEYKYEKVPADFLEEIRKAAKAGNADRLSELHLPQRNLFIPSNLDVEKKEVEKPTIAPKLIRNDDQVRAWFKKDDTFWVPKANVMINARNPLPGATPENALKTRFYCELVRDALEEYAYDAELAGLEYSVSTWSGGFDIQVAGYNDKLPVLLEKVLTTMRDLEVKSDRFEIIKERMIRGMKNWEFQQPYNQVGEYSRWLTAERGYINEHLLTEIPSIKAQDIQNFFPYLLKQLHIESLVHGNVYKEDALRLNDLILSTLQPRNLPKVHWPVRRSLILPPGKSFRYNKTLKDEANVNHCIEYYLHVGDKADRTLRAKTLLLDQMTHEPAFDQLRTKEQLGYVVFSGAKPGSTTIGYRFIIQSERDPVYLESRIDNFLADWSKKLQDMDAAEFEGHKQSLITKRLEKLKNLGQESGRLWAHVESEYVDFELSKLPSSM